ncbi:MAG: metal-dependent hydrolase [Pirellulaceae bacterium]|nr:metal-dependent hydrolase [Pirellulaceae bacterium]
MTVKLTWLGHATWLVGAGSHQLIVDPFLTDNPAAKMSADEVNVDFVLLTHGHFDHVADAATIANRCDATLIGSYEVATWFSEKHSVAKTLGMNIGGAVHMPFGWLKMTQAIHSSQLPDGSYGGPAGGFLLQLGDRRIYFAGDTALFTDMQLIARGGLDVAILPIGDLFTMGPEDSLQAAQWLGARLVLPSHHGTWPPIEQDVTAWADRIGAQTSSQAIVPVLNQPIEIV